MKLIRGDWSRLVGIPVEIRRRDQCIRAGIVDEVMPDSSALWLAADQIEGRRLFGAAEGFEVWLNPGDLPCRRYSEVVGGHPCLYPLF